MNDFTREELQYMAESVDMWFKGHDSDTPERIYLKLKLMIDNYCEHLEYKIDKEFVKVCNKCGKSIL